jgi:hypothetical protein
MVGDFVGTAADCEQCDRRDRGWDDGPAPGTAMWLVSATVAEREQADQGRHGEDEHDDADETPFAGRPEDIIDEMPESHLVACRST